MLALIIIFGCLFVYAFLFDREDRRDAIQALAQILGTILQIFTSHWRN